MIQVSESRVRSFVAPSVEAVEEGELEKGEGVDRVIEGRRKGMAEEGVVLVSRVTQEVEVNCEDLGISDVGGEFFELEEEEVGVAVVDWGVDISEGEAFVSDSGSKVSGEEVAARDVVSTSKEARVLDGNDVAMMSPQAPVTGRSHVALRKEGRKL